MKLSENVVELNHFDICQAIVDYVKRGYPNLDVKPRFKGAVDINNYVKIDDSDCLNIWVSAEVQVEECGQ